MSSTRRKIKDSYYGVVKHIRQAQETLRVVANPYIEAKHKNASYLMLMIEYLDNLEDMLLKFRDKI